jgi:uncharacterized protein (DUF1778 family)
MVKPREGPAAPARKRKEDVVRMRVTLEQKQALLAAAEREGLDVSAWLRQLALRAAGALPK